MADYQEHALGGVLRTSDGAYIPDTIENADYLEFLAWDVSNTPDGMSVYATDEAKADAKALVQQQVVPEFSKHIMPSSSIGAAVYMAKVQEAIDIEGDGSPTSTRYPLLQAIVDAGAEASLSDAGTSVRAEWASIRDAVGEIEQVRAQAIADIDAAANTAAVNAVLAALTWPA